MQINDILKQEKFKDLNLFLTKEMYDCAKGDLVRKMIDVLDNETNAREWFYSPAKGLGGKRPYDYCKQGKNSEVEDLIMCIAYGVYI